MNGNLNGVDITGQEFNGYVVTEDGRTYTSISRISDMLGWDMQVCVVVTRFIFTLFYIGSGTYGDCAWLAFRFSSKWGK